MSIINISDYKKENEMGMYDVIGNGFQIKLFKVPIFYYSLTPKLSTKCLSYSGGRGDCYGNETTLPLHTWWYSYPESFVIIDNINGNNTLFHRITDGKYKTTYASTEELPDDVFEQGYQFYDYYGGQIFNLKSRDDVNDYLIAESKYEEEKDKAVEEDVERFAGFMKYLRELPDDVKDKTDEYQRKVKEQEDKSKELSEKLNHLYETYLAKYNAADSKRQKQLCDVGGYMECLRKYRNSGRSDKKIVKAILLEGKRFIEDNSLKYEDWKKWNNPSQEDLEITRVLFDSFINYK